MIHIFGLLFFIILICLIYLYYQGKISRNIPIIFMFFLILIIPFTYLETNKIYTESFSSYDQIMNSSLDIFYTNQNSKRRQMNELKKIKLINNPIQTVLVQKDIKPITLVTYARYYPPYKQIYLDVKNAGDDGHYYYDYSNQITMTYLTKQNLFEEKYNMIKSRVKNYETLANLNTDLGNVDDESFIIIIGNNNDVIRNANQTTKNTTINTYKFPSWINTITTGTGAFIVILSKSNNSYSLVNSKIVNNNNEFMSITQNLIADSLYYNTNGGEEFKRVANNEIFTPIANNQLISSKINIISPALSNTNYALSFTSENNESFVYLSSRKLQDQVVLYAKSPKNDIGPTSTTYLDTQRPQLWSFEPVTTIVTDPLVVFIRTYTKPYFYLDAELENGVMVLKASRFKAALKQHWEFIKIGATGTIYKIRHLKSEMYLAYSDFDGYLYKDDGSVFLTKSDLYTWNITSKTEAGINKNVIENFESTRQNTFQGMEVPTDYGSVANPDWKISGNVKGKNIVIESKGRTIWEDSYSAIWNGKWIYYGTVASYKATLDINKVNFLIIKIDSNGNGIIEDEFLNFKMNVINAGSNILTGLIPSGEYKGFRATLKLIPTDLKYSDPSKTYPVKMRYFIERDKTQLNLSSGNIYNMEGYSTKFVGDKLILANFLEASGIQTDPNLAFSPQTLQKINQNIKDQLTISPGIKSASKYIKINSSKLLYKASTNGWNTSIFHQLCDNKGPTITVATLTDGRFIGAYSPVSWGGSGYINNMQAFLFDSDNKYTTNNSPWGKGTYAIYQTDSYGPTFGGGHDFLSLASWNLQNLHANSWTFIHNGKGPLGVAQYSYNNYPLKNLEVYSVEADGKLMLKVAGKNDVPSNCENGDYKCQAKDVCEKVTGETCIHQDYDCYYGSRGSWYPNGTPGSSTFNFAYAYDIQPDGYGNICAVDKSYMKKYGLAEKNRDAGSGDWTRQ